MYIYASSNTLVSNICMYVYICMYVQFRYLFTEGKQIIRMAVKSELDCT